MQITVNIDAYLNKQQLESIAGDSIAAKLDTIVQHLSNEFGVYADVGQSASGLWIELDEGSPVDFVKGLDTYKFF